MRSSYEEQTSKSFLSLLSKSTLSEIAALSVAERLQYDDERGSDVAEKSLRVDDAGLLISTEGNIFDAELVVACITYTFAGKLLQLNCFKMLYCHVLSASGHF